MQAFKLPKSAKEVFSLREVFEAYCKMDYTSAEMNVLLIPLTQSDKWLTTARVLDMTTLTTTDTGMAFFKFRKRALSFQEYLDYLKDLANTKGLDFDDMLYKMQTSGKPQMPKMGKT